MGLLVAESHLVPFYIGRPFTAEIRTLTAFFSICGTNRLGDGENTEKR